MELLETIRFNEQGLVPAIVQDAESGQVLMMAWMNAEAVRRTLQTGRATFWSRSRQSLWVKGETSGHTQEVQSIQIDCDGDTLLLQVVQKGAACHEGYRSCFFRTVQEDGSLQINQERLVDPKQVYGSRS